MKLIQEKFAYLDSAALFARIADQDWAIFLDSGVINSLKPVAKNADFDVLAMAPTATLESDLNETKVRFSKESYISKEDPLAVLKTTLMKIGMDFDGINNNDPTPAYLPGALGYFAYDLARYYHNLDSISLNDECLPVMAVGIYPVIVVVDHRKKATFLVAVDVHETVVNQINDWRKLISRQLDAPLSVAQLSR